MTFQMFVPVLNTLICVDIDVIVEMNCVISLLFGPESQMICFHTNYTFFGRSAKSNRQT